MAKTKTGGRSQERRPVQAPKAKQPPARRYWRYVGPAAIVAAALIAFLVARQQAAGPGEVVEPPAAGLPATPDYHSLLVSADDPDRLWLGTHAGLYESVDGGRSWEVAGLQGRDAMNLVRSGEKTVWAAGHNVLARSLDGGATWANVDPEGLPSLDIHGFARDPRDPQTVYAAVAGAGLYRSTDGGSSFELVSEEVGGQVFGLVVLEEGTILAGDSGRGIVRSADGGQTWDVAERFGALGLAVNPADPATVAAAGQGELASGVALSRDSGWRWEFVLDVSAGAGPIAWSESDPSVGYVVGFDRTLYKTTDTGASWEAVG